MTWGSLNDEEQSQIVYLSGHLNSSEVYVADPHAADSAELAWDGFDKLKKDGLVDFATWLSEQEEIDFDTPDGAVEKYLLEKRPS